MTPRRVAFIGLRLVALFLAIRATERLVYTLASAGSREAALPRAELVATAVPFVAAVALWLASAEIAARLADTTAIMTNRELDDAIAHDEAGDVDPTAAMGPLEGATEDDDDADEVDDVPSDDPLGTTGRTWVVVGLMILGAHVLIRSLEVIASNLPFLIWHDTIACRFFAARGGDCPFWDQFSIGSAASVAAGLLVFAAGLWLVLAPSSLVRFVEDRRAAWSTRGDGDVDDVVDLDEADGSDFDR